MPKVLIIEDSEPLRNDVMEMLSFENFDVRGAENGRIGIQVAREFLPDLIICDIMMPEVDGYGVLEALKTDEQTVRIPFIFLSAKTERIDVRRGMRLGADDYLTKPFGAEELLDVVNVRINKEKELSELISKRIQSISDNIITALPHEFRTPLHTIMGFSDMLVSEIDQLERDTVVDWARLINLAANRLLRLVDNYLLYMRLDILLREENEILEKRRSVVPHPGVVIQFHATNRAQEMNRLDDLVLELDDTAPIHVQDFDLGKIVDELVGNGLKFSDHGDLVRVTTSTTDSHLILEVRDSGIGMRPEQIRQIGAAHQQFDRVLLEKQGTGMGFAILRQFEKIYSSELSVSSWDQGLVVTFAIPRLLQKE